MINLQELKWSKTAQEIDRADDEVFWQVESGPQRNSGFLFRSQHPTEATVMTANPSLRSVVSQHAGRGALIKDAVVCVSGEGSVQVGVNEDREHLFGAMPGDKRPAVAFGKAASERIVSLGLWLPEEQELILPSSTYVVEPSISLDELGSTHRFTNVPVVELPA